MIDTARLLAWSAVWDPLADTELRTAARDFLAPGTRLDLCGPDFVATFVAGFPAPRWPLLLHAALAENAAATREAWMRAWQWLGLRRGATTLPPDHLAPACELVRLAIEQGQTRLASDLSERYLVPWSEGGRQRATCAEIRDLLTRFADDLTQLQHTLNPAVSLV